MSGYKTDCPACGGMNYYFTPHNSFGYCFSPSCGYCNISDTISRSGIINNNKIIPRSEYKDEIRNYYKNMTHYYHSCLTKQALTYLITRGYTEELIQRKKIGYCPSGKSHLYKGHVPQEAGLSLTDGGGFLAERVTFPYIVNDTEISDIRGRLISKKNNELKYKSPYGSYYKRWSDYPYNYFLHDADVLLLAESEIKADIAYLHGYNAIGLPGMNIWKKGWVPKASQKVVIVFDNQAKDYHNVQKAITNAANHFSNVKVAVLPLMGKEKAEIDTFILQYGKKLFNAIINGAIDYNQWRKLQ